MQTLFKSLSKFVLISGLSLLVFNCSKDQASDDILANQVITATEVKTILEADDLSSSADTVITTIFQTGTSGKSTQLEDCYTSEYSDTGFTVSFDDCSVDGSEKISGSISVVYDAGSETTSFIATYSNLSVGDYLINGTRSFEMNAESGNSITFSITSNMTITLDDGSIIEEMGTKNFGVIIDNENISNSALTIEGDWTIKRNGNTYLIKITSPLQYIFGCTYVGQGIMELNKNGLSVDIDFGDGTCDDIATMTYPDGTEEEIRLRD
jgi:hypothetical protein